MSDTAVGGTQNSENAAFMAKYESPLNLIRTLDEFLDCNTPLHPFKRSEYNKITWRLVCNLVEQIGMEIEGLDVPPDDPTERVEKILAIVKRLHNLLLYTYPQTAYTKDSGSLRGTSQAMEIFINMLYMFEILRRLDPLGDITGYDPMANTSDYVDVLMDAGMYIYPDIVISRMTLQQTYHSWQCIARKWPELTLFESPNPEDNNEDSDNDYMTEQAHLIIDFRWQLLFRSGRLVTSSEHVKIGECPKVMDMLSVPMNNKEMDEIGHYVGRTENAYGVDQTTKTLNGLTCDCYVDVRWMGEVMSYYVLTELYLEVFNVVISEKQTDKTSTMVWAVNLLEPGWCDEKTESQVTTHWHALVDQYHEFMIKQAFLFETSEFKTKLVETIRRHNLPLGYKTQVFYANNLISETDLEELERCAMPVIARNHYQSALPKQPITYLTNYRLWKVADHTLVPDITMAHIMEAMILMTRPHVYWKDQICILDGNAWWSLLPSPSLDRRQGFGFNYVNRTNYFEFELTDELEPSDIDDPSEMVRKSVAQAPSSMDAPIHNPRPDVEKTDPLTWIVPLSIRTYTQMPFIVKLGRCFWIFYDGIYYPMTHTGDHKMTEAILMWTLILLKHKTEGFYFTGNNHKVDLKFLIEKIEGCFGKHNQTPMTEDEMIRAALKQRKAIWHVREETERPTNWMPNTSAQQQQQSSTSGGTRSNTNSVTLNYTGK